MTSTNNKFCDPKTQSYDIYEVYNKARSVHTRSLERSFHCWGGSSLSEVPLYMISGEIHVVDIISHATLLEYQDISHFQTMHTIIKLHSPYILHPNLITRTMPTHKWKISGVFRISWSVTVRTAPRKIAIQMPRPACFTSQLWLDIIKKILRTDLIWSSNSAKPQPPPHLP